MTLSKVVRKGSYQGVAQWGISTSAQASIAYSHGNDAAGPEIRGLWDAYQIVHNIRTAWIESI
jgi:hypothetical protein